MRGIQRGHGTQRIMDTHGLVTSSRAIKLHNGRISRRSTGERQTILQSTGVSNFHKLNIEYKISTADHLRA